MKKQKISLILITIFSLVLVASVVAESPSKDFLPIKPSENVYLQTPEELNQDKTSDSNNILYFNYRGERKALPRENLKISSINYTDANKNFIKIGIRFNQSINPLSLKKVNIKLNESNLSENSEISYNKKADVITIKMPIQEFSDIIKDEAEAITIEICNIQTFDGKPIKENIVNRFPVAESLKILGL